MKLPSMIYRAAALALIGFAVYSSPASAAQAEDTGGACLAGGPGASSCSYTSGPVACEVTCTSPYYACCYPGVCVCRQGAS